MTNSYKVGVMGGGSWGTTVAALMTRNADVKLWARSADTVSEINESHSNVAFLPGARLPETLVATHSIEEAVRDADLIVMGIPSHAYRVVLEEVARYVRRWVPVISLAKGLEQGTRLRMSQVSEEVLPGHPPGVLTGPNLAREIALGQAAASVSSTPPKRRCTTTPATLATRGRSSASQVKLAIGPKAAMRPPPSQTRSIPSRRTT